MGLSTRTLHEIHDEVEGLEAEQGDRARHIAALRSLLAIENMAERPPPLSEPKSVRNTIYALLRERGAALHYREIARELAERGTPANGQDAGRTVAAHLSNDPRFRAMGQGRWGLASWGGNGRG